MPLSNLPKLTTLSLGKNRLENPSNRQFPSLPATMKQLKVHGNSLSSIPKQICDPSMRLLEKLDLSFNNLAEVPAEICNLGECQSLIAVNLILEYVLDSSLTVNSMKWP